jgi:hypothetical protein
MPQTPAPHTDRAAALIRGLQMLIFAILFAIAESVLAVVALLQLGWLLATGAPNPAITRFGRSLALWLRAVGEFQSCATDAKPFPWTEWPRAD